MLSILLSCWDIWLALVVACLGAYYGDLVGLQSVTTELIAFFSVQAAMILPAMVLTAGVLRPEGVELTDVDRFHNALRRQMAFWVALLLIDVASVFLLIFAKYFNWTISISINKIGYFEIGPLIFWFILFFSSLSLIRMVSFVRGIMSLLDLQVEFVRRTIKKRNSDYLYNLETQKSKNLFKAPEGWGDIIDHPKQ